MGYVPMERGVDHRTECLQARRTRTASRCNLQGSFKLSLCPAFGGSIGGAFFFWTGTVTRKEMVIRVKTKRIVTCAMLVAMYVVLSFFSLNLGNMKITIDALPIIVGAVLFGPAAGFIIGMLGSFLNQLLTFGVTATTLLWIIPAGVRGLMVGFYSKQKQFNPSRKNLIFILILSSLVVTTLNTGAIYLDSVIYGYYSFAFVFGTLVLRYITGAFTALVFVTIVPTLIAHLKNALSVKQ